VHGVGRRFDSYFDRRWGAQEIPRTFIVLIGQELDAAILRQALADAVAEPA
jgi:cobalamin biosynthesis protein CobW